MSPTQHITGCHLGEKSFQAIHCTATDDAKIPHTPIHSKKQKNCPS